MQRSYKSNSDATTNFELTVRGAQAFNGDPANFDDTLDALVRSVNGLGPDDEITARHLYEVIRDRVANGSFDDLEINASIYLK